MGGIDIDLWNKRKINTVTMIGILIIMTIGITLIIQSIREWNRDIQRIRELEERLEQYYKERERRLNQKLRNIENHNTYGKK